MGGGVQGHRQERLLSSVDLLFGGTRSNGVFMRGNTGAANSVATATATDDVVLYNETAALSAGTAVWATGCFAVGASGGTAKIQISNVTAGTGTYSITNAICVIRKLN